MKDSYSISEILLAVNEIKNKKKEKRFEIREINLTKKVNSDVPINTLKLIEEAEKVKN